MVVEACGGAWGPSASKIFADLAKTKSVLTGESKDVVQTQLFPNLGVILHRQNVRAVARKIFSIESFSPDLLHAATTFQASEAEVITM